MTNQKIMSMMVALIAPLLASATVRYVATDGSGDGSSWAAASSDLQAIIDASESGDEIWVAAGTYKPSKLIKENKERSKAFILKNGVSLYGGFAGNETSKEQRQKPNGGQAYEWIYPTILSADDDVPDEWTREFEAGSSHRYVWTFTGNKNNSNHVLYNNEGLTDATTVEGFTLKGAFADVYQAMAGGAAAYVKGHLELRSCIITENCSYNKIEGRSYYGGAVALLNTDGKALVEDCLFEKNQAQASYENSYGGGVYSDGATVRRCTFRGCVSKDMGGAVYNEGGTVEDCTFEDCYGGSGGAIYNAGTVSHATIYDCRALQGGGIYNEGEVAHCLIANNYADTEDFGDSFGGSGGGIYSIGGTVLGSVIYNCTSFDGGGLLAKGGRVVNCTVQHNAVRNAESKANIALSTDLDEATVVFNTIGNPDAADSNFENPTSFTGFTTEADKQEEIRKASWKLANGSKFIDAGGQVPDDIIEDIDIAGNTRISGLRIDTGAYESNFSTGGINESSVTTQQKVYAYKQTLHFTAPITHLCLYNLNGEVVYSADKVIDSVTLPELTAGIYVARFINGGVITSHKIVLTK